MTQIAAALVTVDEIFAAISATQATASVLLGLLKQHTSGSPVTVDQLKAAQSTTAADLAQSDALTPKK